METIPITCPKCGAHIDIENVQSTYTSCDYCGNTIYLKKAPATEKQTDSILHGVDLRDLIERHGPRKLTAIKEFKDRTGLDLKASKDAVDEAYARWNFGNKSLTAEHPDTAEAGRASSLKLLLIITAIVFFFGAAILMFLFNTAV